MIVERVSSQFRQAVNVMSRKLIPSEALRKTLVEIYYENKAKRINRGSPSAQRTADELVDWRKTLSLGFEPLHEVYRGNCFYGVGGVLSRFAGMETCAKACIEHGVYFGDYVNEAELDGSGLSCLISFGPKRRERVGAISSVPVATVGPYIAYAEGYLCEEDIRDLHRELGKTLLLFPMHSVDRIDVEFDTAGLVDMCRRVKSENDVDTVLACLFYRDLLDGAAAPYEEAGFTVVTAGYREDPLFLDRLRSLIEVSDLTMSNGVGTHVGYCAFLGKPHLVCDQERSWRTHSDSDKREVNDSREGLTGADRAKVADAFCGFAEELTECQRRICNEYWGFEDLRSAEEMRCLLALCEEAHKAKSSQRQDMLRRLLPEEPYEPCRVCFE